MHDSLWTAQVGCRTYSASHPSASAAARNVRQACISPASDALRVEGLSCYLPMRFVSIGKPHVHHERISVVGAFNPIGARLWFQSHRDKSHFPNCPMVAKNLRFEGTSVLRSGRVVGSLPGLNRSAPVLFREAPNPFHLPGFLESRRPGPFNSATLCQDRAPAFTPGPHIRMPRLRGHSPRTSGSQQPHRQRP